MGTSLLEMYPEEFSAEKDCMTTIERKSAVDLDDIQKLLQAKNNLHLAINFGREDAELEAALDLSSIEGKQSAARIFARDKVVYLVAQSNMKKASYLNKHASDPETSSSYIETVDRILARLTQ